MDRTEPHPAPNNAPYWLRETDGDLAAAMRRYIGREELSVRDVGLIRAYLRKWVDSPIWDVLPSASSRQLSRLRERVFTAGSREQIDECVKTAKELGMNPL